MTEAVTTDGHTPGPWRYQLNHASSSWYVIAEGKPWFVCEMSWNEMEQDNFRNRIGSEANARLIAAAPDLLALAKQYASECAACNGTGVRHGQIGGDGFGGHCTAVQDVEMECGDCADIRAAIAKAEGRS